LGVKTWIAWLKSEFMNLHFFDIGFVLSLAQLKHYFPVGHTNWQECILHLYNSFPFFDNQQILP